MPLFDLECSDCRGTAECYVPANASLPACHACGGPMTRPGVETFSIRAPQPTGVRLKSGQFVKGTYGSAPRRVARRIKTFT